VYRNHEWILPFLWSLNKTLFDRSRRIYIVDSSPLQEFDIARKMDTFGLDVSFIHFCGTSYQAILTGIQLLGETVCVCDADTIFALDGWDSYIESKLKDEHYHMVGVCPRFQTHAETTFIVASKKMIVEAGFRNSPPKTVIWDDAVLPLPRPRENSYLTYLHCLQDKSYLLFGKHSRFEGSRWGQVIRDDQDREFIYHNFYSARCKKENDIPQAERDKSSTLIDACADNARVLFEHIQTNWPPSLETFIREACPVSE